MMTEGSVSVKERSRGGAIGGVEGSNLLFSACHPDCQRAAADRVWPQRTPRSCLILSIFGPIMPTTPLESSRPLFVQECVAKEPPHSWYGADRAEGEHARGVAKPRILLEVAPRT